VDINIKAQNVVWEKMMAYLFLERSLKEQYQYPTTIEEKFR